MNPDTSADTIPIPTSHIPLQSCISGKPTAPPAIAPHINRHPYVVIKLGPVSVRGIHKSIAVIKHA